MKSLTKISLWLCAGVVTFVPAAFAADEHAAPHHEHMEHADAATAHHADGHHESAEGLPQFDPSSFPSQIFWLVFIFVILYIFFSRKTLPDISGVIETRQEHIQSDLDMAAQLKEDAEKVHEAYEEILDKARLKSTGAFTKADEDIKAKAEQAAEDFRKRSADELKKREASIEKAKNKIIDDMDAMAAQVASEAAAKIIGVKADIKKAESVVQSIQGKGKKKAA